MKRLVRKCIAYAVAALMLMSFALPAYAANSGCQGQALNGAGLNVLMEIIKKSAGDCSGLKSYLEEYLAQYCNPASSVKPPSPSASLVPSIELTPAPTEESAANDYELEVVELVNEQRRQAGLKALEIDESLMAAARARAVEIKSYFSHTRPDGRSCFTILKEYGVSYKGAGENIASGQSSAKSVMNGWMNSSGHRANILNSKFTKIGVGCYKDAAGRLHWAQLFIY